MSDPVIRPEDVEASEDYFNLPPTYFAFERVVEELLGSKKIDAEAVAKPLVEEAYRQLRDAIEETLLSDVRYNLRSSMEGAVDDMLRGLMTGEKWLVKRYVLDVDRGRAAREALVKLIPEEIIQGRISDLEKQVAALKEHLAYYKGR